jgi:UDP-N-acetylglucosamine/UDP-N-acetylgalactosamine diphosphorylase
VAHFKESEYFGLNRGDVIFLIQDELPVVNRRGKIFLAEPGRIATSPNGHGGVLLKLLGDDALFHSLEVRGIEHLFYFQVDNALARIADPVFLGYHLLRGCEASSKTVCKVDPEEKVGIFCQFNGSVGVVEYRELSPGDRTRKGADGGLELSAGNIGIHAFSMDFLRRLRGEHVSLPYHFVEGKTPHLDKKGGRVVPGPRTASSSSASSSTRLPLARSTLVLEAKREEEFSPVKCLNGASSVASARRDLSGMYARWLAAAGANVKRGAGNDPGPIEISPLYALDAEELKAKLQVFEEGPLDAEAGLYLK